MRYGLALLLGLALTPAYGRSTEQAEADVPAASTVVPAHGQIEIAFTPGNNPEALILRHLQQAREEILVQAYVFTSQNIAKALVAASARGVRVVVLADARMNARGNAALQRLLDARIPLAFETAYAAAHNKVILVDPRRQNGVVLTGSYNFTWSARERNAENLLALSGNPALTRVYLDNWLAHQGEAQPVKRFPWKP